jgi:SAM-dependent methyltransferase
VSHVHHGEFRDLRVVALYDLAFPWSRDDDFFVSVLADEPARDVLDLGCGTGRLAIALAARGYAVTGVDPAGPSLALARRKAGADAVTWIEGSTEVLPADAFDAAVMTSHVAQFFVSDEDFAVALAGLRRALRRGGRLIFDSRDPAARAWEGCNPAESRRVLSLPDGGTCTTWAEVTSVVDGAVSITGHYEFSDGDRRLATLTLRFRTEAELRAASTAAGLTVTAIYGGWNRDPIGHPDGELLVVARAAPSA